MPSLEKISVKSATAPKLEADKKKPLNLIVAEIDKNCKKPPQKEVKLIMTQIDEKNEEIDLDEPVDVES